MEDNISRVEYLTLKGISHRLFNKDYLKVYDIVRDSFNYDYRDTINAIYSLVKKEIFIVLNDKNEDKINANSIIGFDKNHEEMFFRIREFEIGKWNVTSLKESEYDIIFHGFGNNIYLDYNKIIYNIKNNCEKVNDEEFNVSIRNLINKGIVFEYDDDIGNHIFKLSENGRAVLWNLRKLYDSKFDYNDNKYYKL